MVGIPAELVAAAVILEFWAQINNAIWIVVFGFLIVVSNLCFIRVYGELEFVFAMLKIMLIVGLNIMVNILSSLTFPPF
jgi:amino acid transporter